MADATPALTSTIGQIPRTVSAPAELFGSLFEVELTLSDGSKASAKVGMGVILQAAGMALPGPNDRRDLRKHVRCYSVDTEGYRPGDTTLAGLTTDLLCLGTTCTIELGEQTVDETWVLRYDSTGPLQVYLDGRFTGPKITARWVRLVGEGGDATATVPNVTETQYGFPAGGPQTFSFNEFANKLLSRYQYPGFSSFTIQDQGSQTVEVGTLFPAGFKSFKWAISNANNLADNATITIVDETGGTTLVANTPNDGVQSLSTVAFSVANGLSRRYRISTANDKGETLAASIDINGSYRLFYGPTSSPSTTSAQARGLLDSRLLVAGNQFVLDSGVSQRFFEVEVPPGKTIVSVVDLDNLNQVITSDYVASALSVNDIGGTARTYTRYVKTQAVPYSSNHRHQITLS